jgi:hypothetical protein
MISVGIRVEKDCEPRELIFCAVDWSGLVLCGRVPKHQPVSIQITDARNREIKLDRPRFGDERSGMNRSRRSVLCGIDESGLRRRILRQSNIFILFNDRVAFAVIQNMRNVPPKSQLGSSTWERGNGTDNECDQSLVPSSVGADVTPWTHATINIFNADFAAIIQAVGSNVKNGYSHRIYLSHMRILVIKSFIIK